jgi:phosphoglycerate dehydrogenase-like enzyme
MHGPMPLGSLPRDHQKKGQTVANKDINVFYTLGPGELREMFWGEPAKQRAEELGFNVRFNPASGPQTTEYWAEALEGVEALITTWLAPKLDEAVLARNTTLKIVGHAAGSVGGVVTPAFYERGIPIVMANDIMAQSVAEWCLMATQIGWNRFLDYSGIGAIRSLEWSDRQLGRGMQDATMAIWGYGAISSRLITLLQAFGPKDILVYSGHMKKAQADKIGITLVDFDELFERGDVIHLLGALTEKNIGKLGAKQLATIKDNAVLVQAGRAMIADEDALLAELRKNRFMAILDVHYTEPVPADSPFRNLPNVVLTPHVAGYGRESLYVPHVLEEFDRFFRGEPLTTEVKPDRAAMMTNHAHTKKK